MKPVAIFRFSPTEGPGYFASFLDRHSIPWRLFRLDEKDTVPSSLDDYSGFVFMGGPMSVNDDLPWIAPVTALIQKAIAANAPCLGHCLGGQLISKAMGGMVSRNPVKEIGWNPVRIDNPAVAREWLGADLVDAGGFTTFQWHGETFTIPPGAVRILTGDACANQAYVLGNSLGLQCHVEMTPEMIENWCRDWAKERVDADLPSIQTPDEMLGQMRSNLHGLNEVADRLYRHWTKALTA